MTPTVLRVLWELYSIDRADGHRWVDVAQLSVLLRIHADSIHRVLMTMKPKRLVARNSDHPRQWRILQSGRDVGRMIDTIARQQKRASDPALAAQHS